MVRIRSCVVSGGFLVRRPVCPVFFPGGFLRRILRSCFCIFCGIGFRCSFLLSRIQIRCRLFRSRIQVRCRSFLSFPGRILLRYRLSCRIFHRTLF